MEMARSGAGVLKGEDVELHLLAYRRLLANGYLSGENPVIIALYIRPCPSLPTRPQLSAPPIIVLPITCAPQRC